MGIHDRIDPYSKVIHLADLDNSQVLNGEYTSDDASSVSSVHPPTKPSTRRSRNGRVEALNYQSLSERLNLSMVRTLVGLEESEIEGEFAQLSDNYGHSIFSSLFLEAEKMQAWNTYIEMSEEDQMLVIEGDVKSEHDSDESIDADFVEIESEDVSDMRSVHPSYSSDRCFFQIEQRIRNFLKRRHVPLGLLEKIELDVREHFREAPYCIFEVTMETSFGRLLVHAVAQYLGLDSFSMDNENGKSLSVVCKAKEFRPPKEFLSQYLEWKSGKHQDHCTC
ncbi:R3H domain-containing protein 4-like isoform X2 [Watersipora subatra]|uniref:R3H domain-containing protein 4-like isoform X2 n=1 Tax=Watersipora subatra TaxID=2589382 RepID=UPI00355BBFCE